MLGLWHGSVRLGGWCLWLWGWHEAEGFVRPASQAYGIEAGGEVVHEGIPIAWMALNVEVVHVCPYLARHPSGLG